MSAAAGAIELPAAPALPGLRAVRLARLGYVDYGPAWRWQAAAAAALRAGEAGEALALLEHRPVYTLGRRARRDHLLVEAAALRRRGAAVVESDRGGGVTFHGPGQLVLYPILDLRGRGLGPAAYVRALEQVVIETLRRFGLQGERIAGWPGVWAGRAKVAAIGVRVTGGVSSHGIALNVETDLSWFEAIVPCGIGDAGVTSIERLLGRSPGIERCGEALLSAFCAVFGSVLTPAMAAAGGGDGR